MKLGQYDQALLSAIYHGNLGISPEGSLLVPMKGKWFIAATSHVDILRRAGLISESGRQYPYSLTEYGKMELVTAKMMDGA